MPDISITSLAFDLITGAFNLVFPGWCPGCDRIDHHGFCPECYSMLEPIDSDRSCKKCGSPGLPGFGGGGSLCPDCRTRPTRTEQSIASFKYSGPLSRAIVRWKYHDQRHLSSIFTGLMTDWVVLNAPEWWETLDFIIPTPQHPGTLRIRGFSPPDELSGQISKSFAIPLLPRTLYKIRETPPQARLSREDRERNLYESMCVFDGCLVSGKNVLVIDDVMTTGTTMNECARAILKAGALNVYGFVLARQSEYF